MAVSLDQINGLVTKTLNWLRDRMVPTGTIICGLYTAPPAGYLAFKRTDRILKSQYPALCALLFKINGFKGDGSTYANIPDVDHRVLEMCSNISEVGQLMEAGLPNITGGGESFEKWLDLYPYGFAGLSGAFYNTGEGARKRATPYQTTTDRGWMSWGFGAHICNGIYGKSGTNQPSAVKAFSVIKT